MDDGEEAMAEARSTLLAEIEREVAETKRLLGKDRLDAQVMAALDRVPRHAFVPDATRAFAYDNRPLPIGHGQTISQPYIVAVMTDMAAIEPGDRVLEIGTGCGYQTAVLAELAEQVVSVEVVPELAKAAAARLEALGYTNVEVHTADGGKGWPAAAPYDAIVVTAAAARRIPPALLKQLAPGGRLVIPVERGGLRLPFLGTGAEQELLLLARDESGRVSERSLLPVAFVPLVEAT